MTHDDHLDLLEDLFRDGARAIVSVREAKRAAQNEILRGLAEGRHRIIPQNLGPIHDADARLNTIKRRVRRLLSADPAALAPALPPRTDDPIDPIEHGLFEGVGAPLLLGPRERRAP